MQLNFSPAPTLIHKGSMIEHYKKTATLEIFPSNAIVNQLQTVDKKRTIAITCSPSKGIDVTLETAITLSQQGFHVRPHIAAHMVKNAMHLKQILQTLLANNILDIFVIGGDSKSPIGTFHSAIDILFEIGKNDYHFNSIGIAGYPQRHPKIDQKTLMQALQEKQAFAEKTGINVYIITQMCFRIDDLIVWASEIKEQGIELPVVVGIPGICNLVKLLTFSKQCGIKDTLSFLKTKQKLGFDIGKQISSNFDPQHLLQTLVHHPLLQKTAIAGMHIYTFNTIEQTEQWLEET